MPATELPVRYGINPHQSPACLRGPSPLPVEILHGEPGMINLLDAVTGWQLVRELRAATGLPAAAAFKHVTPAGAAVGLPLSAPMQRSCGVADLELSPLAAAYVRARGADRVSSFGDWAACSDRVDVATARVLRREVSHGVIAPAFDDDALAILRRKLSGDYRVIRVDPGYEPSAKEVREVFGLAFHQARNDARIDARMLARAAVDAGGGRLSPATVRDLLVALVTLKYTPSNAVCLAVDGQVVGNAAGQQSRIHATRLAAGKARTWWLRQHREVLELPFVEGLRRPQRDNATEQYLRDDLTPAELRQLAATFRRPVAPLPATERSAWLARLTDLCLASDGYLPFRDNVDQAAAVGVTTIVQPGGSVADDAVRAACSEHGIAMLCTGLRLFHH